MLTELRACGYGLALDPRLGGSISRFDWRDQQLFRPTCGSSILDTACFPLVPFSNRIASGRFAVDGRAVQLKPNFPGSHHPHPLHGFGWLAGWEIVSAGADRATLRHLHVADEWPWDYVAEQEFVLGDFGMVHRLRVRNLAQAAMPIGLGFHPYLPRDHDTSYCGLHRGEWQTATDGLPFALTMRKEAIDWWHGEPVGTRVVDTVYEDRRGPLVVTWRSRGLRLTIEPSVALSCTVVYVPPGADFFCVEPVSHATDAINREGLPRLPPGKTMEVEVRYFAEHIGDA